MERDFIYNMNYIFPTKLNYSLKVTLVCEKSCNNLHYYMVTIVCAL